MRISSVKMARAVATRSLIDDIAVVLRISATWLSPSAAATGYWPSLPSRTTLLVGAAGVVDFRTGR